MSRLKIAPSFFVLSPVRGGETYSRKEKCSRLYQQNVCVVNVLPLFTPVPGFPSSHCAGMRSPGSNKPSHLWNVPRGCAFLAFHVCAHLRTSALFAFTRFPPPPPSPGRPPIHYPPALILLAGRVGGPDPAARSALAVADVCKASVCEVKLGDMRKERRPSFEPVSERVKQGSPIIAAISALFVFEASRALGLY